MIRRKKKVVLYFPQQANPKYGEVASKDLIPLSVLTIAAWPDHDGYDVVIVDANVLPEAEAHRRVVEECEDALVYGTTGILGYQVTDAYRCSQRVRAAHPELPMVIGGWFASVLPELQLETGLYDAVCLGQGEMTFRDVVHAVDAGEPLDEIPGLVVRRDGAAVRTPQRRVVGYRELLNCPWHLLDIAPYRDAQLAGRVAREVPRIATPPGYNDQPFFGISYYGSFGCPEPCTFCCSPEFSGMRWKSMPGDRMADDLCELHERWGFDTVRFVDANWAVMEKRTKAFCDRLIENDAKFHWYGFMQAHSIQRYKSETLDAMRDARCYEALIGGETGDAQMMASIGKHSAEDDNLEAAVKLAERDICSLMFYVIGYPGETTQQMLNTIDECRRIAAATPLARPTVWPFRPIPGTPMFGEALELGHVPPRTLEEWGDFKEYHVGELDSWPGQFSEEVIRARKLYEHYYTLSLGLARGHVGWWERRAQRRMASGDFRLARLEAKAFAVYDGLMRRVDPEGVEKKRWIKSGIQTARLQRAAGRGASGAGA